MATQRIISSEKTVLDQDDPSSPTVKESSSAESPKVGPAVPTDVIVKLLGFTLAMIVLPIGSYFATVHTVFRGNSTFAGAFAAVMANVILIGYVIVAMKEDQSERDADKAKGSEGKKQR